MVWEAVGLIIISLIIVPLCAMAGAYGQGLDHSFWHGIDTMRAAYKLTFI
jgi:hypothetical protein